MNGQENKTSPALAGRGHLGNANARRISGGRRYEAGDNPRGATFKNRTFFILLS